MKLSSYQNLRVPTFSVHALRSVLEEAGLDWRTALMKADIDPKAVTRPGGTIPAEKELAFQLQFVALTQDRVDLWLRAARAYTTSTFGARGMALATAPTVTAWVNVACAADNAPGLLNIAPVHEPDGTVTGVEFTYPGAPDELIAFSVYRELFVVSRSLAWLYGETFPFSRIEFPLDKVSSTALTYISCTIDCGSENLRFRWDPAIASFELPFGNAFQHAAWVRADDETLDSFRTTGDWPDTVSKVIRASPDLNRKLANAATTLRVSPRTLQRRLELAGTDFAQLRDETLNDLASEMLSNTDYSVARISRVLGYADPASFTIAFKRWTQVTPTAFREASHNTPDDDLGAGGTDERD